MSILQLCWVGILCLCVTTSATAETLAKRKPHRRGKQKESAPSTPRIPLSAKPQPKKPKGKNFSAQPMLAETPESSPPMPAATAQLNTVFGLGVAGRSGLTVGGQYGYAFFEGLPLYLGPELNFSLYNNAHLFAVMGGGWTEWRLSTADRLVLTTGAFGGVGFAARLPRVKPTVPVVFLDLSLAQEIDELVTIRGQLRPGVVGPQFAYQLNVNICFRFL